jgi:hypothetical protein
MTPKKLVVALTLLLSATSITLAQDSHEQHPGPYYGNDYGPDNGGAQTQAGGGTDSQQR